MLTPGNVSRREEMSNILFFAPNFAPFHRSNYAAPSEPAAAAANGTGRHAAGGAQGGNYRNGGETARGDHNRNVECVQTRGNRNFSRL